MKKQYRKPTAKTITLDYTHILATSSEAIPKGDGDAEALEPTDYIFGNNTYTGIFGD